VTEPLPGLRPFTSVGQALQFHRRLGERLRSGATTNWEPRIQDGGGPGKLQDLVSVYLSVDLCLAVLGLDEAQAVGEALTQPQRRLEPRQAGLYHRAMTKLGREMRRRGVVG
jgi:hypothetical protein